VLRYYVVFPEELVDAAEIVGVHLVLVLLVLNGIVELRQVVAADYAVGLYD
jgi:hypothetical protein